jgi:hypothetical protein
LNLPVKLAALSLLSSVLFSAQPRAMTIEEVLARLQSMRKAIDFRASGRLVTVSASGARKTSRVSLKGRSFDGVVKLFYEVADPVPARVRLIVETFSTGKASIQLARAGDRRPKDLPFQGWGEPFLDSDLSYEDLLENHFLWRIQSLIREEKYGSRNCLVIRSEPGPADRSQYSAVTTWLDREIYCPVLVEKTIRTSGAVKEFTYYGLRQSKGLWSADQIEVRVKGEAASTLLIITRGSERANVNRSEFDPALLVKPY